MKTIYFSHLRIGIVHKILRMQSANQHDRKKAAYNFFHLYNFYVERMIKKNVTANLKFLLLLCSYNSKIFEMIC